MRPNAKLTPDDVRDIKTLLWDGYTQKDVARQYDITQPYVSLIVQGSAYPDIPWPDGDTGPMDRNRWHALQEARRGPTRTEKRRHAKLDAATRAVFPSLLPNAPGVPHMPEHDPQQAGAALPFIPDVPSIPNIPKREETPDVAKLAADALKEDLEGIEGALEQQRASEIKEALTDVGEDAGPVPTPAPLKYELMDWDLILEKVPDLPLLAIAHGDETVKLAIQIVFNTIPEERWTAEGTPAIVKQVVETLEKEQGR